jgi:hypothetical protein
MLSNAHFYFQSTRKYIILFGNLFNNISLIRKNKTTGSEIERIKIPIIYAPKEKYIARLASDPDLQREIQVALPRMSFEMTSISYDASRKQNSLLKNPKASSQTSSSSQYVGVPYDLGFELNIYTRNVDDGTHIVEQILPYFNPDYTVAINPIADMGFIKDTPIILNSVTNSIEHEGNFDAVRFVTWRLTFNMKAYFYGPITQSKIIRKIDTNIYNDPSVVAGYIVRANLGAGAGTFKLDDIVYQGNNYTTALAYGKVSEWKPDINVLQIGAAQGQFTANSIVRALSSNASYTIASFDSSPLKLVNIHITPNPADAELGDDFGYTTVITEWPNTNQPGASINADSTTIQADLTTLTADTQ